MCAARRSETPTSPRVPNTPLIHAHPPSRPPAWQDCGDYRVLAETWPATLRVVSEALYTGEPTEFKKEAASLASHLGALFVAGVELGKPPIERLINGCVGYLKALNASAIYTWVGLPDEAAWASLGEFLAP